MRIGVYGGSFNPIHTGHIRLAQSYLEALSLDKILVIPANIPPHKRARQLLPGETRLELCRLACLDDPRLEVSDIELQREGSSYTVDTLRALKVLYPGAELHLIVGSDMFMTMETWTITYKADDVREEAAKLSFKTPGVSYEYNM